MLALCGQFAHMFTSNWTPKKARNLVGYLSRVSFHTPDFIEFIRTAKEVEGVYDVQLKEANVMCVSAMSEGNFPVQNLITSLEKLADLTGSTIKMDRMEAVC
eukprot:Gregarina_sp_Poly_1__3098@NODE_1872_length_3157_cov_37_260841_g1214_i0_p2_GENE_NODE_1872_length_3157_cov_37_260841_g1214_i0NODE_1872_length_3157_cov_37_260841_g1214_i0_p2_ORF_typecomplete_len102_score8_39zfCCHC_6/PF15288_6/0_21_NODE_1872_length_3157_cov_37_260841_g1214_i039344